MDHCQVTKIAPGETVTVTTSKGLFTTKKLVITAGPWAPAIMAKLGLKLPFEFKVRIKDWLIQELIKYAPFPVQCIKCLFIRWCDLPSG